MGVQNIYHPSLLSVINRIDNTQVILTTLLTLINSNAGGAMQQKTGFYKNLQQHGFEVTCNQYTKPSSSLQLKHFYKTYPKTNVNLSIVFSLADFRLNGKVMV